MSSHAKSLQEQLAEKLNKINGQHQPYLSDGKDEVFDNRLNKPHQPMASSAASFVWPERFSEEERQLIGIEIADTREKLNMTQGTLARLTGIAAAEISRIETGKVVRIDKATIKNIGHVLGKDFNEEVQAICTPSKRSDKSIVASTNGRGLTLSDERTVRIGGHNFEFKCSISDYDFKVVLKSDDLINETTIYQGKRAVDGLFLDALKEIARLVNKGL